MTENKNSRMRFVKIALAVLVVFGAGQSYAECTQSNLTGTWYFTGMTGDVWDGYLWETDSCKVNIKSNGVVANSGSKCNVRDAVGKYSINLKGGKLLINASCAIEGKIKYCLGEFCVNLLVDSAKLDKGKTVITLVGRASDDAAIVSYFTGVKK